MEEFIKEFKDLLSIKAIQDKAGIKGNLIHQILREEKYRKLSDEQIQELEKIFLPVNQALTKYFAKKD